ncbi:MAG: calcium:proton antiporter [Methylacidiphilales bacterium]|nr:calcium:proton antiporter [Candidatus Methylacidiphilales bacterium]
MSSGKLVAAIAVASALAVGGIAVAGEDTATPEEVVSKVWAASRFLHDKGASGLAEFNSKDGQWVWKDSYVFVYDCRLDRMVAHPLRPDLVGRPVMQITDNSGKFIFKELCQAGSEKRGGWVEYLWTRPGAGNVSRKISYALGAEMAFSSGLQVAAGVYDDKATAADLLKLTDKMADPTKYPAH